MAQQLDDGFLVYFGYPQAHEDDAQRAIHTGLQMVETLGRRSDDLQRDAAPGLGESGLAVRVGIHTGVVIAEPGAAPGAESPLAVGATPRLAAGLRELALPQTVVISEATAQRVQSALLKATLFKQLLISTSYRFARRGENRFSRVT